MSGVYGITWCYPIVWVNLDRSSEPPDDHGPSSYGPLSSNDGESRSLAKIDHNPDMSTYRAYLHVRASRAPLAHVAAGRP